MVEKERMREEELLRPESRHPSMHSRARSVADVIKVSRGCPAYCLMKEGGRGKWQRGGHAELHDSDIQMHSLEVVKEVSRHLPAYCPKKEEPLGSEAYAKQGRGVVQVTGVSMRLPDAFLPAPPAPQHQGACQASDCSAPSRPKSGSHEAAEESQA